jgi:hypothetical protein
MQARARGRDPCAPAAVDRDAEDAAELHVAQQAAGADVDERDAGRPQRDGSQAAARRQRHRSGRPAQAHAAHHTQRGGIEDVQRAPGRGHDAPAGGRQARDRRGEVPPGGDRGRRAARPRRRDAQVERCDRGPAGGEPAPAVLADRDGARRPGERRAGHDGVCGHVEQDHLGRAGGHQRHARRRGAGSGERCHDREQREQSLHEADFEARGAAPTAGQARSARRAAAPPGAGRRAWSP